MFSHTRPWTITEKILFRFCCLFFLTRVLPLPYVEEWLTSATGRVFFGLDQLTALPDNGSGDGQWVWVWSFAQLLLSIVGTLIWSLADRHRSSYNKAKYVLDTLVLYYLAFYMLVYGGAKIAAQQMPFPSESRLWQRVGDMSPMGLLWTFIGSSTPYQVFCGAVEVLGGVLLLFRRTRLLGALVSGMAMFQVFVLNMCYDVPVKIFSFFLLLLSLYLCLPQMSRMFRFFFTDHSVEPYVYFDWFSSRIIKRIRGVLVGLFIVGMGFLAWQQFSRAGSKGSPASPIEGSYVLEKASRQVDSMEWTNVSLRGWYGDFVFMAQNEEKGARSRWKAMVNDSLKIVTLKPFLGQSNTMIAVLHYTRPDSIRLHLQGVWGSDSLRLALKRRPKRDFLLIKRGFHWINNEPFNR